MTEINPIETTTNTSGEPTSVITLTNLYSYNLPPRPVINVMDGTMLSKKGPALLWSASSSSSYVSDLVSKRSETQSPTLSEDDLTTDGDQIIRLLVDDTDQRVIPLYVPSPHERDGSNHRRSIFVDEPIDQSIIPISVEHVEDEDERDGSVHHRSIIVDDRHEGQISRETMIDSILPLLDQQRDDKENVVTVIPLPTHSPEHVSRDGSDHHRSILVEDNYGNYEAAIEKPVATVEAIEEATGVQSNEEKGIEFVSDEAARESRPNLVHEGTADFTLLVQPQEKEADHEADDEELEIGVQELNPTDTPNLVNQGTTDFALLVQPEEKEADEEANDEEVETGVPELNPLDPPDPVNEGPTDFTVLVQPEEKEVDHEANDEDLETGVEELNPLETLKLEVGVSEDEDELQVSDSEDSADQEEVEEVEDPSPPLPEVENEPSVTQQAKGPVQEGEQELPKSQAPAVEPSMHAPSQQPPNPLDIASLLAEMKAKSRAQLELLQEKMATADNLQHKVHDLELRHNKLVAICQAFGRHDSEAISLISKDLNKAMLSIVASGSGETLSLDSIMPATPIAEDRDTSSGNINTTEPWDGKMECVSSLSVTAQEE